MGRLVRIGTVEVGGVRRAGIDGQEGPPTMNLTLSCPKPGSTAVARDYIPG
jgi:hypothetical protein